MVSAFPHNRNDEGGRDKAKGELEERASEVVTRGKCDKNARILTVKWGTPNVGLINALVAEK